MQRALQALTNPFDLELREGERLPKIGKGARGIWMQGGQGTAKTYSALIHIITQCAANKGKIYDVVGATLPHMRTGVIQDFEAILNDFGAPYSHYKSYPITFELLGNKVRFFSVDKPDKARGPRRDGLYVNEADRLTFEAFNLLAPRTRDFVIGDYNPTLFHSWVYDIADGTAKGYEHYGFFRFQFGDNPNLPESEAQSILARKGDNNWWRVYGLGERGATEGAIYKHASRYTESVEGKRVWGLDFGFNDPCSLVCATIKDQSVYAEEKLYQSYLTESDLIRKIKDTVPAHEVIYCDAANPDKIESLRRAGLNATKASKNINEGILRLQSYPLHIHQNSANLWAECVGYTWEKLSDGSYADKPDQRCPDHALDALRYAVYTFTQSYRASSAMGPKSGTGMRPKRLT